MRKHIDANSSAIPFSMDVGDRSEGLARSNELWDQIQHVIARH